MSKINILSLKNIEIKSAFIFVLWVLPACVSTFTKKDVALKPSQLRYENEAQALTQWQQLLEKKEYLKVNNEITNSIGELNFSKHWYGIMFTYGLAKEGLEDWSGALQVYQNIIGRSTEQQWEYVALAMHRRAYCYEVMLDNEKALASLMDAARLKSYLPLEITLAEIPARVASVYARMNQPLFADQFTKKAERGIQQLRSMRKNNDSEFIARTLYKMGGLSLTQVDESSFIQNIRTLIRNQRFLIQSIELSNSIWSQESEKALLRIYTNLWNFIENYKVAPSSDWQMDWVKEGEKKSELLSQYLEAIEKLKSFESPPETTAFLKTAAVYNQIKTIETRAVALLNQELLKKPWDIPLERMPSSESFDVNSALSQTEKLNLKKQKSEVDENWDLGRSALPKKKIH